MDKFLQNATPPLAWGPLRAAQYWVVLVAIFVGTASLSYASLPTVNYAFAQQTLTGQVFDEQGQPVAGATVRISNTNVVTATDDGGRFSLMAKPGDVLVVNLIGYKPFSVTIANAQPLRIALEPEDLTLDEVVIVGYGTQKKAHLTGAVSSL